MQSRYSNNQNKKSTYIKWTVGSLLSLLLIVGTWLYVNDWDVEQSFSALKGQQVDESEVSKNETDGDESVVETPKEPDAEEPATEDAPAETETPDPESKDEQTTPEEPKEESKEESPTEEKPVDATTYQDSIKLPAKPTYIDNILLANKQHPLPQNYAPGESKEARAAFEAMKKDAQTAGIKLIAFSTYRDFARQKELYEKYVAKDGAQAADRYSARPGFSEHQSGLAFDIGEEGQQQHWASASFGGTEGGKWVKNNAHKYGFILRYPEGAENITGYMHEAWHFRFVGNTAAEEIFTKGITLEQYLGVQ